MATFRKAGNFMAYVLAIFISGIFSLFGRSAPTWADEIKAERSVKIFSEVYQVPQARVKAPNQVGSLRNVPRQNSPDRPFFINQGLTYTPEIVEMINQTSLENHQGIDTKLIRGVRLSLDEINFLKTLDNASQIEDLRNQIKTLMEMIDGQK